MLWDVQGGVMRWAVVASLAGLGVGGACRGSTAFECATMQECDQGDDGGICQPTGFCSYPDGGCESGQRYGDLAGPLSNTCVPVDVGGTTGTGDTASASDPSIGESSSGVTASITDSSSASSTHPTSSDSSSSGDTGGGSIEFTDDELDGEFGEGQFMESQWYGDEVRLAEGASQGVFTSRIFDAGAAVSWSSLGWVPAAPYDKPLPANGLTERGYPSGIIDMADNVMLLRFDEEAEALGSGEVVSDRSGHGNDATVVASGNAVLLTTEGKLGRAVDDSPQTYLRAPITDDLQFGTEDFTWAMWIQTTADCVGDMVSFNQVYLGVEDAGDDRVHLWLGCMRPTSSVCPEQTGGGYAGGTFRSVHIEADGASYCGTTDITDGQWHHMVVTKTGHEASTIDLYVDGVLEDSRNASFIAPLSFFDDPELAIGAFSNGSFQADVTLDELAIWRRALSADEVAALYQRGAARLRVQVRGCDDADCTDAGAFFGPDGSEGAFVDSSDQTQPPAGLDLSLLGASRYVQYQVVFERDGLPAEPGLRSITLTAP